MGSADTFMNLSQGLAGNIQKATRELTSFNDLSQSVNKSFSETNKNMNETNDVSQKVNDSFDDISDSTKDVHRSTMSWGSALGKVKDTAADMFKIFAMGGTFLSMGDAVRDSFRIHQEMTDVAFQMGMAKSGAKDLEDSMYKVQMATGQASEEVTAMITTLAKMRVASGDIQQLATDALNFSTVTGASADAVGQMTGNLVRMGGLGQKSVSNILGSIMQTQRAFGMTGESVEALTDHISETTSVLKNMGKSVADIEKFQKGTVKLAGAFESVGVQASEAASIIDRLLDPSKLEDNAFLYSQLGISIEDAISGNINPEDVIGGLQNIGAELQDMAGPQAAAMAEALGMPLNQLRQMGNVDMAKTMAAQMGLVDASDALSAANDEQSTSQRDMQQMWQKIKGTIGGIVSKLMPAFDAIAKLISNNMESILGVINGMINSGFVEKFIGKIGESISWVGGMLSKINPKVLLIGIAAVALGIALMKKKFFSVGTDSSAQMKSSFKSVTPEISKSIEDGVVGGMEMAAEKSSSILIEKMKQAGRLISEDHQRRVTEGHQHAALSAAEEYQKQLAGQNTWGWAKKINENTAEWLGTIKGAAKPTSLLGEMNQKINDKITERGKLASKDYEIEMNSLKGIEQASQDKHDGYARRTQQIRDLAAKNGIEITNEQQREIEHNEKMMIEEDARLKLAGDRWQDVHAKKMESQKQFISLLSNDEKLILKENSQTRIDDLNREMATKKESNDLLNVEKELMKESATLLTKQEASLLSKKSLTATEAASLVQIQEGLRQNGTIQEELTKNIEKGTTEYSNQETQMAKLADEMTNISEATEGLSPNADAHRGWTSIFHNVGGLISGNINLAKAGVFEIMEKTRKSVANVKKGFQDAFSADGIRGATRHLIKGTLKAGKNLASSGLKAGAAMAKKIGGAALNAGKKLGTALKDGAKNAAKGLGKGLAIAGGGLLLGALAKSEAGKKMMEKLQGVMSSLMEKLGPTFEKLMPIIDNLVAFLMPIVEKVANVISGLVEKLMPVIMGLMEKAMPIIQKLLGALMPVITQIIEAVTPILEVMMGLFMDLVGSLLPAIMPLLTVLMDLMMPLVKALLPPILKALGFLLKILGTIIGIYGKLIKALGNLPGLGFLKDVGEGIEKVGDGIKDAGDAMGDAANVMSGSALKLAGVLENGKLVEALDKLEFDGLKKNVGDLTSTLGITSEQATSMSHSGLVEEIKSNGKRSELVDQMFQNTKALADQLTLLQSQNLSETILAGVEAAQEGVLSREFDKISSLNVSNNDGQQQLVNALIESGRLDDFYKAMETSGGNMTSDIASSFSKELSTATSGGGFDIADAVGGDMDALSTATEKIGPLFEKLGSMADSVELNNSDISGMINTLGLSKEEESALLNDVGLDKLREAINGNGGLETANATITRLLAEQGSELQQAGMERSLGALIERSMEGLERAQDAAQGRINKDDLDGKTINTEDVDQRDRLKNLRTQLATIQSGSFASEEDRLKAVEKLMRGSDDLVAASIAGQASELKRIAEASEETNKAAGEEPSEGEVVTKLYPAIVEATSSGFVMTREAESRTTGLSNADKLQMELIELTKDANRIAQEALDVDAQKLAKEAEIAADKKVNETIEKT